jgi:microcin C transport system permease protein
MRFRLQFNPTTRKRLLRFRSYRRAYASAWLLAIIFALTLAADLLCNDKPLFIKYEGRSYFPVIRFYTEQHFLPEGKATRPDYKSLNRSPLFIENSENYMVFPPIPFGPRETVREEDVRAEGLVTVTFQPIPLAGNINITPERIVSRARAASPFFGMDDDDLVGQKLASYWPMNTELQGAIDSRFRNEQSPPLHQTLTAVVPNGQRARLSLSTYRPRTTSPSTIRITFRTDDDQKHQTKTLTLNRSGNPTGATPPIWNTLAPEEQSRIRDRAKDCRTASVDPLALSLNGQPYRVLFDNSVAWPYPPVRGHWLGIDSAGRDVLSRIVHGLRVSLVFGILLVVSSMLIGIIVGAIQGYYGGIIDIAGQRLIEIWSAIPFLYVMILLGSIYGSSFWLLLTCYAIFNWIGISYYMRAEFLRLRKQPFVDAARVLGVSSRKIILRHVLPNAITPIITFIPFYLVGAIAALAALDYLGFGLPALTPSLGQLLHQAQANRSAWWLILYPSLALFVVMLLGVFVGEGVREAYDPRPRTRMQ